MKRRPFYILWALLLTVCVICAVMTRGSFVVQPSEGEAFERLQYFYRNEAVGSAVYRQQFTAPAETVIAQADCVVIGTFTGERTPKSKSYLCQVVVHRVLVGDAAMEGTTISVYEPVPYEKYNVSLYESYAPEMWAELKEQFQITQTENLWYLGTYPQYDYGNTLMQEGETYVFFLNDRELAQGMATPEQREFIPINSPYSKLWYRDSVPAADYELPPIYLSVAQAAPYEILMDDLEIYREFLRTKAELFQLLGVADTN